jgi:hypothetical protein
MFGSTMLLTVGHAIDRAKEEGMEVRMNIGGEWVSGRVMNSDGHGVALLEGNGDMCVVRRDAITCVRLSSRTNESRVPNQQVGNSLQTV